MMQMRRWLMLAVMVLAFSPVGAQEETTTSPTEFDGERAYEQIAELLTYGPRITGSAEMIAAGDYLLAELDALGWETSDEWHTLDFGPVLVPARNLIASKGPTDGPVIIIGGHHDSRVYTDQDPDPNRRAERALGANDNASGVGVILEMARVISEHYEVQQEIRFVFFDAEDNPGIQPWGSVMGSRAYVDNLSADDEIDHVVILDMVGDMDQFIPIEENSRDAAPEVVDAIWNIADDLGYGEHITRRASSFLINYRITDDHVPFIRAGIPAVVLIDFEYPYWHTTQDTLDKISITSLERVGHTMLRYLQEMGAITPK